MGGDQERELYQRFYVLSVLDGVGSLLKLVHLEAGGSIGLIVQVPESPTGSKGLFDQRHLEFS